MDGVCYIALKCYTKLLHNLMIIIFHSLVYPIKHNSYKTILVKVCNELLILG